MRSKPEDYNNHTTIKMKDKPFSRVVSLPINLMVRCYTIYTPTYFFLSFLDYTTVALILVQLLSSSTPQANHFRSHPLTFKQASSYWLPLINREWVGLLTS